MIWMVIWTVLMVLWLVLGGYMSYDPAKPHGLANSLLPWACVLILGLAIFGAISTGTHNPAIR